MLERVVIITLTILLSQELFAKETPPYFYTKSVLERENQQFRQTLQDIKVSSPSEDVLQVDQYLAVTEALDKWVTALIPFENQFKKYPSTVPNTQEELDQTIHTLVFYTLTAEVLSLILPNQSLATILSEYSTKKNGHFVRKLIDKTKFHFTKIDKNDRRRLHKAIESFDRWPLKTFPPWLIDYVKKANLIVRNSRLLSDNYFTNRPRIDVIYSLKASILYPTGLVALPKDYYISHEQINKVQSILEPGDIAVIKHLYKLTNIVFSGEWSHGLIYLGSWNKLKKYFDSDDETNHFFKSLCRKKKMSCKSFTSYLEKELPQMVQYYRNDITNHQGTQLPRTVLESKGDGVIISNIYEALRKDQLAVFRPNMSRKAKAISLLFALRYVFRPYDYNFNFQSHDQLVCTEIIYHSYSGGTHPSVPDFPWEVSQMLGNPVVQANDLVKTFAKSFERKDQLFDFVVFLKANKKKFNAGEASVKDLLKTVAPKN